MQLNLFSSKSKKNHLARMLPINSISSVHCYSLNKFPCLGLTDLFTLHLGASYNFRGHLLPPDLLQNSSLCTLQWERLYKSPRRLGKKKKRHFWAQCFLKERKKKKDLPATQKSFTQHNSWGLKLMALLLLQQLRESLLQHQ